MASELTVQTIRGPLSGANADKIIIPTGQTLDVQGDWAPPAGTIVGYKRYVHTGTVTTFTSTTWVTVGQTVEYTPKYSDSLLYVEHNNLMRGDSQSFNDARFDWRVIRNGVDLIGEPTPFGNYDRGSHGIWNLDIYTYREQYQCTSTNAIQWYWQVKSSADAGTAELYWNEGLSTLENYDGGRVSTTIIWEIKQ